jgi:hypothetical protein
MRHALTLVLLALLWGGCEDADPDFYADGTQALDDEENDMSAPLFVRTPAMVAMNTEAVDVPPLYETVISHGVGESTTMLVETLRFFFSPAPVGGRDVGYVELAVLTPGADVVALERYDIAALAEGEYAPPVFVRLDLLLPPGYALQIISTPLNNAVGFTASCHVVAQGGELG